MKLTPTLAGLDIAHVALRLCEDYLALIRQINTQLSLKNLKPAIKNKIFFKARKFLFNNFDFYKSFKNEIEENARQRES